MEKTIHLLSSGLDSPVAAYLLVKAGIEPVFLFFDANPYNTEKTKLTAIKLASKIAEYAKKPLTMFVAPHGNTMKVMQNTWDESELKYSCIFCKRIYYRIAVTLAKQLGAHAISTGEIISEQASQTIDNMALIQEAIGSFLVVRPLLTWNKVDVIAKAHEIGTYEISNQAKDPCLLVPKYPITHGRLERYKPIEEKLPIQNLMEKVMKNMEKIELKPDNY